MTAVDEDVLHTHPKLACDALAQRVDVRAPEKGQVTLNDGHLRDAVGENHSGGVEIVLNSIGESFPDGITHQPDPNRWGYLRHYPEMALVYSAKVTRPPC